MFDVKATFLSKKNGSVNEKSALFSLSPVDKLSCISTGVFGFPAELACPIAVRSVRHWLDSHQHCFESIIFNVFSRRDESLYEQVLEGLRHG